MDIPPALRNGNLLTINHVTGLVVRRPAVVGRQPSRPTLSDRVEALTRRFVASQVRKAAISDALSEGCRFR
jgi:hypothetical protein